MVTVAVHPSAELYGSDRVFLESVSAMEGAVIAVVPSAGPLVRELERRGVPVEIMRFPVLRKAELRTPVAAARHAASFAVAVSRLARWLRHVDARTVYVSTIIAPVWIYAARRARMPVVVHVHETEPTMPRLAAKALLWPLRGASQIIANSQASRRWIVHSTSPRTSARTTLVYNGIEPSPTPEQRTLHGQHLVVVGRLSERKGQDVAIRALALLRSSGHTVARLTLVGDCFAGNEHVQADLRALAADLGITEHVAFVGFQDPQPYVAAADIVVVPSRRAESFGLVAAEALLAARPTVVSQIGGLPEIVTDGRTGRTVPAESPQALAAAIAELLADPVAAENMAFRGRADVLERFSAERYAQRLRETLRAMA